MSEAVKPYYDDGQIQIFCGDCRDILPTLAADVIVTDPPYGMGFVTGKRCSDDGWTSRWTGQQIEGDDDTTARDTVLSQWTPKPALVFGTWKCPRPIGVRETLVWDKVVSTGMGDLDIPWRPSWEEIYVIGKGFVGSRDHGVLRFSLPTLHPDRRLHPTVKPIELLRYLISRCPEGVILDPFMGSGTTLRAAKDLGRRAIGIELSEAYCAVAVRRLQQQVLPLEVA